MADAHAAPKPDAAAGAKKKPPILIIALVGLNLSALAAVGAYLFLMNGAEESPHHASEGAEGDEEDEEGGDEEEEGDEDEEERPLGPLLEFESLVVNLSASGTDHYLKTTFQLEVWNPEALEHVETHMVPYRDRVLSYFGSLTVEQVTGPENVIAVREQLLTIAREVFGRRKVRAIFFTELLVQ